MQPIDLEEILGIVFIGLCFLIPVVGITARIALKPMVEAFARVRESSQSNETIRMLERRMDLMEQEIQSIHLLREDVAKLLEVQEFQLKLAAPHEERSR